MTIIDSDTNGGMIQSVVRSLLVKLADIGHLMRFLISSLRRYKIANEGGFLGRAYVQASSGSCRTFVANDPVCLIN